MSEYISRGRKARRCYGFDEIALVPGEVSLDPNDVDVSWMMGDMKIEVPAEVFDIRKWTCRVRSNQDVATFIRQLVLELPEGEELDFRAGGFDVVAVDPDTYVVQAVATGDAAPACASHGVPAPCLLLRANHQAHRRLLTVDQWASSLRGAT